MARYIFIALVLFNFGFADAMVRRVEVQQGSDTDQGDNQGYYYEEDDIWYGPGWYNGIWFGTEFDFNDWHGNHYHDYHHQHWGGNHAHGGGGWHGGGGHGGGGRR